MFFNKDGVELRHQWVMVTVWNSGRRVAWTQEGQAWRSWVGASLRTFLCTNPWNINVYKILPEALASMHNGLMGWTLLQAIISFHCHWNVSQNAILYHSVHCIEDCTAQCLRDLPAEDQHIGRIRDTYKPSMPSVCLSASHLHPSTH